jgi:hypothetical protein
MNIPVKENWYAKQLAAHPQCNDPEHPSCPVCDPEEKWLVLRLTPAAQGCLDIFIKEYADRGCTCFASPPCSFCTHEGNPENLLEAEDPETWETSDNPELTSREWLKNHKDKL